MKKNAMKKTRQKTHNQFWSNFLIEKKATHRSSSFIRTRREQKQRTEAENRSIIYEIVIEAACFDCKNFNFSGFVVSHQKLSNLENPDFFPVVQFINIFKPSIR